VEWFPCRKAKREREFNGNNKLTAEQAFILFSNKSKKENYEK